MTTATLFLRVPPDLKERIEARAREQVGPYRRTTVTELAIRALAEAFPAPKHKAVVAGPQLALPGTGKRKVRR